MASISQRRGAWLPNPADGHVERLCRLADTPWRQVGVGGSRTDRAQRTPVQIAMGPTTFGALPSLAFRLMHRRRILGWSGVSIMPGPPTKEGLDLSEEQLK